jgi:lipopolysaccharide transport system ATP-binding protein
MPYAIQTHQLSKQYRLGEYHFDTTLREAMTNFFRHPLNKFMTPKETLWAIREVSLEAKKGEVIGIIGRNSAGKSTLLKLLSKITYPTSGSVKVKGRAAALLEVGTGFHSELTGRENIYLNGSILGMKRSEIHKKLDRIIAFSGVEKFIDTPIKRYSSGMELRLGFAVAAHLDVDVMFVDEVLAVGDSEFQKKCLRTMGDMRNGGRTVLFVSHNMAAVENLCPRTIWIDGGRVMRDGETKEVIGQYLSMYKETQNIHRDLKQIKHRKGSGEIQFVGIELLDTERQPKGLICSGDSLIVRLHYEVNKKVYDPHFGVELYTELGTLVASINTWSCGYEIPVLEPGKGYVDLSIEAMNLVPSQYYLSLWLASVGPKHYDRLAMDVEPTDFFRSGRGMDRRFGLVLFPCRWELLHTLSSVEESKPIARIGS